MEARKHTLCAQAEAEHVAHGSSAAAFSSYEFYTGSYGLARRAFGTDATLVPFVAGPLLLGHAAVVDAMAQAKQGQWL